MQTMINKKRMSTHLKNISLLNVKKEKGVEKYCKDNNISMEMEKRLVAKLKKDKTIV